MRTLGSSGPLFRTTSSLSYDGIIVIDLDMKDTESHTSYMGMMANFNMHLRIWGPLAKVVALSAM